MARIKNKCIKYGLIILGAFAIFSILFGVGIYRMQWKSNAVYYVSQVIPYPAILVDWEGISFYTYIDDLRTLEKYWNFQRENTNVLLGIPEKKDIRENLVNKLIAEKIVKIFARKNSIIIEDEELYLEWEKLKIKPGQEQEIAQFLNNAYGWDDKKFIDQVLRPFLLQQKVKQYLTDELNKQDKQIKQDAMEIYVLAAEQGADFGALAKQYSEDSASAQNQGDIGYFARGTMDPYFESAVFSMQISQISEPVKSSYGYHIIKLEDLLYNDQSVATQARVKHILIKGFDFDEWIQEQKKYLSIYRLVL